MKSFLFHLRCSVLNVVYLYLWDMFFFAFVSSQLVEVRL